MPSFRARGKHHFAMKLSFTVETVIPERKGTEMSWVFKRASACIQAEGHEGRSAWHQPQQHSLHPWGPGVSERQLKAKYRRKISCKKQRTNPNGVLQNRQEILHKARPSETSLPARRINRMAASTKLGHHGNKTNVFSSPARECHFYTPAFSAQSEQNGSGQLGNIINR